jgi:hypothetical protein
MWKSLMRAVLEAFAMSDPVCYTDYMDWKREAERQNDVRPYRASSRQEILRPIDGGSRAREEISA